MTSSEHDRITHLPGLEGDVDGAQFAGYVPIVETADGSTDQDVDHLFYWLAGPADYQDHPVVLWTNGGPGSPSFWGVFTENGPYAIDGDGTEGKTKLVKRDKAWNRYVTYLVIEHPLGATVSFPKAHDPAWPETPREGSDQYYHALANVLKRHGLVGNPLALAGESYAGTYLPLLAIRVFEGEGDIAAGLRGIVLGDAWVDPETQMKKDTEYAHTHGLISLAEKQAIDAEYTGYPSPYNGKNADSNAKTLYGIVAHIQKLSGAYMANIAGTKDPDFKRVLTYLNRGDVREALHITNKTPLDVDAWGGSDWAWNHWNQSQSMLPTLERLLAHQDPEITVLVLSGLNDAKDCNFLGTEAWLHSDEFTGEQAKGFKAAKTSQWHLPDAAAGDPPGGFEQGDDRLRWLKVLNAGHMAVMDQPDLVFYIMSRLGLAPTSS